MNEVLKFLELIVGEDKKEIFVHNKHSVSKIICHFGMENCNPVPTLLPSGITAVLETSEKFQNKNLYQSLL